MGMFSDPITARPPTNPDPSLINEDFSPTTQDKRTFDTTDYATFWITLVISITTYYLAASLVDLGEDWVVCVVGGRVMTPKRWGKRAREQGRAELRMATILGPRPRPACRVPPHPRVQACRGGRAS